MLMLMLVLMLMLMLMLMLELIAGDSTSNAYLISPPHLWWLKYTISVFGEIRW